ncbi:Hpt domain-containing protein [Imperialibacter roseus]|uniref:Hpt domain-containing protein n=1 Tax=Imperialibacter roseus TaxID=1324217 RepID=A0ABZ0IUW0_9BACT|nr:Hpt domain-containing protein [Imperialibacter roseus]WOK08833.1 Hpt domain-containing protein [Imperialibacter roseus]
MANIIDLSYLEKVCEGDTEFMKEMIEAFIDTIPENLTEMQSAHDAADWPLLARIVHKMKPSIAFMGIEELKANVLELEALAKEGKKPAEIKVLVNKVDGTTTQAIAELSELLKTF